MPLDDAKKSLLLEAFRAALEEEAVTPTKEESEAAGPEQKSDLFSLFSELAALKSEVHLEARQFKTALERFGDVTDTLEAERESWKEQLARARENAEQSSREALKPLLLELLELRDRLEAGLHAAERYRPKRFASRSRRREAELIQAMRDGQELTLRRLENLLVSHDVRPIPVLDRELDPHTMRAAEIDRQTDKRNGVVTAELRKGFFWGDTVLRTAEVKVNKL
jgi:molecular chaperone GrpE